jgi:membrane-bound ClpP family serine protease
MKQFFISRAFFGLVAGLLLMVLSPGSSAEVLKVVVNDSIHPITDEYIGRAITEAEHNKAQALLIEINTPGGLLESTRDIIEKILASPVPVIIYVTPSGAAPLLPVSSSSKVATSRPWRPEPTPARLIPSPSAAARWTTR